MRPSPIAPTVFGQVANDTDLLSAHPTEQINIGAISGPALSFVPRAIAHVAHEYPLIRLRLQVESSDFLLNALRTGRIDVMVGRLIEGHDPSNYNYSRLSDESVCAVARQGHPLLKLRHVRMQDLAAAPWIVPQAGSILRYRFDLMFRDAGCPQPRQIIEAVSQMVVTRLLEETHYLGILARDVAEHYASSGSISIVPITLPCKPDSFGIVTRKDWLPSRAAQALCEAIESAATSSTRPSGRRRQRGIRSI